MIYIVGMVFIASVVWLVALSSVGIDRVKVVGCDVGQGDGALIQQGNAQIVIDGGPPNGKMLQCLSRHMPFWDRTIEFVVITHPQLDHYGGLIEVLDHYNVKYILTNSRPSSSSEFGVLKDAIGREGSAIVYPEDIISVRVGLISLEVLWPSYSFVVENALEDIDPNNYSIVTLVKANDFEGLFTGDIGPEITPLILQQDEIEDVDLIKVPHHGSKNGLIKDLLVASKPEAAIISVGNNQWGHPHDEILNMLTDYGAKIYRTDSGTKVFRF